MAEIIYTYEAANGVEIVKDDAAQKIRFQLSASVLAQLAGGAAQSGGASLEALTVIQQQLASLSTAVQVLSAWQLDIDPNLQALAASSASLASKVDALADPANFLMLDTPMQAKGTFRGFTTKAIDTHGAANAVTGEYTVPTGWSGLWAFDAQFQVTAASLATGVADVILMVNGSQVGAGRTVTHGSGETYSITDVELQSGDKVWLQYLSGPVGSNGRCFRWGGRWLHAKSSRAQAQAPATRTYSSATGVNLGNFFEAPVDGAWGRVWSTIYAAIDLVADTGFKLVRMPARWSNHATLDEAAIISPAFMDLVFGAVDYAIAKGLRVTLNAHHYRQLDGDNLDAGELAVPGATQATHQNRLVNMIDQVSARVALRDPEALEIEPYNEPHILQDERPGFTQPGSWSGWYPRLIAAVRARTPRHTIVLGGSNYNNSDGLTFMTWTGDQRTVANVHGYPSKSFTHQGTDSNNPPAQTVPLTPAIRAHARAIVRTVAEFAAARTPGRRGRMNEFGVAGATQAERLAWLEMMRVEAESAGVDWTVFTDGPAGWFPLQSAGGAWQTGVIEALLGTPPGNAPDYPASLLQMASNTVWEMWAGTQAPSISADGRLSWGATSARQGSVAAFAPVAQLVPGAVYQYVQHGVGGARVAVGVQTAAGQTPSLGEWCYAGQAQTITAPASGPPAAWKLFLQVESGIGASSSAVPHICRVA